LIDGRERWLKVNVSKYRATIPGLYPATHQAHRKLCQFLGGLPPDWHGTVGWSGAQYGYKRKHKTLKIFGDT
jgi:hypothetical protein